ncbi:ABC transporter permease [Proteinivorax tanatarense]|uniref:ABC transporter permease n=1 Tax=Proteinivorax tanatarense TaxID=1260629 RepID=A0AAU7VMC0_9FIRM
MKKYLIRRLLILIPVLLGVSIIVFALVEAMPGNPYSDQIDPTVPQEEYQERLERMGYYDPLPVRYARWLGRSLTLDFGYSTNYGAPVTEVIAGRLPNTILLGGLALVFTIVVAVPLGVISATNQYSILDYAVTVFAFIGLSIPAFFFGLLMIKFLSFELGLFPISGTGLDADYTGIRMLLHRIHHLILPTIVLGLLSTASVMRYTRSSMLEVIQQDYIRTARAKGLNEKIVIYKHALKNAMIPVVTVVALMLPTLVSGAVLTETIFSWPGVGTLMIDAINNRDYPLLMGITMMLSTVIVFANLLADILYAVIDPRIKYD